MSDETIRDDIYPNLTDTMLWTRDDIIKTHIQETHAALERIFPTRNNLIRYINRFDHHEDAELLISVCKFYNIVKNHADHPFLKFIMMISIFEKLSCLKYLSFHDWLIMEENRETIEQSLGRIRDYDSFKAVVSEKYSNYIDTFGLKKNLLRFFKENMTTDEKIKLIRSFETTRKQSIERARYVILKRHGLAKREYHTIEECSRIEQQPIEERLLPHCYSWNNCYLDYGRCCPDISCNLLVNENLLDDELKRIINIIYDYRSMFVHQARSPPFTESEISFVSDIYNDRPIIIYFNLDELQEILENSLKRYFDRLQS